KELSLHQRPVARPHDQRPAEPKVRGRASVLTSVESAAALPPLPLLPGRCSRGSRESRKRREIIAWAATPSRPRRTSSSSKLPDRPALPASGGPSLRCRPASQRTVGNSPPRWPVDAPRPAQLHLCRPPATKEPER